MSVLTQILSVEFVSHNKREGVSYKPYPLDRDRPPATEVFRPVHCISVAQAITEISKSVDELIDLARLGQPRSRAGIETAAKLLARQILPRCGLAGLLTSGAHPQIDTGALGGLQIPWETLEERYRVCSVPGCSEIFFGDEQFCRKHGKPLQPGGGKLALTYQLSQMNRGSDWSVGHGNRFLIIADPREDLGSPEHDPTGYCRAHTDKIADLVEQYSYEPIVLAGRFASYVHVLEKLRDPEVIAVYYFGHGAVPKGEGDGCLLLADDTELYANEIQDASPPARFVFLNACLGAGAGDDRDRQMGPGSGSVADAFRFGNANKVVIAPLFPVLNVQAVETALTFFTQALAGSTCGEAITTARQQSLERYQAGEPHISWMAYRYFGDPNRGLPAPEAIAHPPTAAAAATPIQRVFEGDERRINPDLFSFAIDDVLLRAAKRRLLQDRELIAPSDLFAGLVRCGDLTRYLLISQGIAPDETYRRLVDQTDLQLGIGESPDEAQKQEAGSGNAPVATQADAAAAGAATTANELLEQWTVRAATQLADQVQALFEAADQGAQERGGPMAQVCEQDLLLALVASDGWAALAAALGLPDAVEIRRLLVERETQGRIDGNGALILPPMTAEARRIVEIAHTLGQQCGACPIPNRVMLAALLQPDGGHTERCCERGGVDPVTVYMWMLATAVIGGGAGAKHWFGLSLEAADRILLPTLERAKALATDQITERDLFMAFCDAADPAFKQMLRQSLHVDLDELRGIDPGDEPDCIKAMVPAARRIIFRAHRRAQQRGHYPIPPGAVLAAFLANPDGLASMLLRAQGLAADQAAKRILDALGPVALQRYSLDAAACEPAVTPMVKRAHALAGDGEEVTEQHLLQAFCEVAPPALKGELKHALGLDLSALGQRIAAGIDPETLDTHCTTAQGAGQPDEQSASAAGPGAQLTRSPRASTTASAGWVDPSRLDPAAAAVLTAASRIARESGWPQVRTPHLVAAMIGDGATPTAAEIRSRGFDPLEIKNRLLELVPRQGAAGAQGQPPVLGENVANVLGRAITLAAARPHGLATTQDILRAVLTEAGGPVGEFLCRLGITGQFKTGGN